MRYRSFLAAILLCATARLAAAQEEADARARTTSDRLTALVKRVAEYQDRLSWSERVGDLRLALVLLKLEKINLLVERYGPFLPLDMLQAGLEAELKQAENHAARLADPLSGHTQPGRHELAYLSPIDLSVEPLQVYVPTSYDPQKPSPLMVFLHGYDSLIDRLNWTETMYSPEMQRTAEENGFLVVLPYGRSNTEFMGVGEAEVLHALGVMKRLYNVDERRILLCGASMGGSGAYSIATHHPHLFSGLMAITGRMDFYLWMGAPRERFPRFQQVLADTDYAQAVLENLRHVPVLLFQGSADQRPYPLPEQSRRLHAALRALGYDSTYHEFEGRWHYIWGESFSHEDLGPWMRRLQAPTYPRRVTFATMTLKYPRAYWAEIERIAQWGDPARLDAEVSGPNRITLTSENIARLVLRPGPLVDPAAPLRITWNGRAVEARLDAEGACALETDAGPPPGGLRKTPRLCGPVREAYCGRFLIVQGTQGTPDEQQAEAQRAADEAREWIEFTQGRAHVRKDVDVTDEDIREANLILIGSPWTNRLTARVAPALPIAIEKDAYVLGARRVPREGVSLLMIYPNPLNPDRYVVVSDGPRWGRGLDRNHKLDLVPDFILFTQETAEATGFAPYVEPIVRVNRHVCAGFFDAQWRLSERLTWWAEETR